MLDRIPIHSILFGLFPVVCGFSSLATYLLVDELFLPVAISLVLSTIVLLISYAILKNWRRAGIVTSTLLLMNYSYDAMAVPCNRLVANLGLTPDDRYYLLPFILLVCLVVYLLGKSKSDYKVVTSVLNVMSVGLIGMNIAYIVYHEVQIGKIMEQVRQRDEKELAAIKLTKGQNPPDIYYIILDAFGRTDRLKAVYDFDNSEFVETLKSRGFVIPPASRSNYAMTCLSLPSSLNMEYLDYLEKILGSTSGEHNVLYRITQHNRVSTLLKNIGYQYVNIRSGWSPTDYVPDADVNLGFPFGNIFHLALIRNTAIGPLQLNFDFLAWAARQVRVYAFNNFDTITAQVSPKFVFVHVGIPHPPFFFKEDGSGWPLNIISLSDKYEKDKYVGQVKFVQRNVMKMLDALDKDKRRKVVIIQGDHGPAFHPGCDGDPKPPFLRERMRILNAYRLPDAAPGIIYDDITPVNSFRVVLNQYFDAKLPLLPDKCFYSPNAFPLQLVDVTKEVTTDVVNETDDVPPVGQNSSETNQGTPAK
ncbi:MAG: LTA synthase family protein [Cyanobacteria bacterium]|nr:LTA synthase family protein [Cyanobacteriota bacterium]